MIGHALALGIVSGLGMRSVADRLGVPMTTAREWRRRFQLRAPALAAALVAVAVHLDPAAVVLSTDGEAAALEVLGAAWQRARTRFGEGVPAVAGRWGGFRMLEDETLARLLDHNDKVARKTNEIVLTLPDLNLSHPLPEAAWFEPGASWSARRVLLHVIAETAQHAGHADIIRESLDGSKSMG